MSFFYSTILFIFLIIFNSVPSFGDAAPKFANVMHFYFYENGKSITELDSIVAFVDKGDGYKDTATLYHTTADYWMRTTLSDWKGCYRMKSYQTMYSFVLVIFKNNKRYQSEKLNINGGNYQFEFDLEDNRLVEVSPPFRVHPLHYPLALAMTLILEMCMLSICLWKWNQLSLWSKAWPYVFSINLLTHPLLWFLNAYFDVPVFMLELLVIPAEAWLWSRGVLHNNNRAVLLSLWSNLFSWWIGGLIIYILLATSGIIF